MDRRTFLLTTGRWLLLASLAPTLSGCARLLRASDNQNRSTETEGANPDTSGSTGSSASVTTSPLTPTSSSTGSTAAGFSTNPFVPPDLAVVKGEVVEKNVRTAVALLGGMERFVRKGGKVVIKPNVLTGRPPEYATTTSPELMTAIIKMCWEAGAKEVVVFDRTTSDDRAAFETAGLAKAVSDAGGKLVYLSNRNYEQMEIPEGKVLTSWPFVADALSADSLINLTLPKHHSVAGATMTMKNLMGIMGGSRGRIHLEFAQKIVDVNTLVKPTLAVLDAYRVLFRHGPTGGDLADVKLAKILVAGTNQVSIDAYGTQFLDKRPTDFEWLREAFKRGMGEIDLTKLNIATSEAV
jgi:uncharacterized protein (DUF362 family)